MVAAAAAPLVVCAVGFPAGTIVGLFWHRLVPIPEATLFGLTLGLLVAGSVVVGCLSAGPRGIAAVGLMGLWAAWLFGWPTKVFVAGPSWMLAAPLGLVVVGGAAGLALWWRAGNWPYRRPLVLGGWAVLAVLLVLVPFGVLFRMSSGFGTQGDYGNPETVVNDWIITAFPGGIDTPDTENLRRITCDGAGGKQAMAVYDSYVNAGGHKTIYTGDWYPIHTTRHGEHATVQAHIDLSEPEPDNLVYTLTVAEPWTFTVVHSTGHGWRVCGLTMPDPNSPTPTPT
jgi:hypothetical protein